MINLFNFTDIEDISNYLPPEEEVVVATYIPVNLFENLSGKVKRCLDEISLAPNFSVTNEVYLFVEERMSHHLASEIIRGAFMGNVKIFIQVKLNAIFVDVSSYYAEGYDWAQCRMRDERKLEEEIEYFNQPLTTEPPA